MKPTEQHFLTLLRLIGITKPHEIGCTEFMHRVAGYAERMHDSERALDDESPTAEHAEVIHHLRMCPECLEEFQALFRALCDED